jgi:hypothetical protein
MADAEAMRKEVTLKQNQSAIIIIITTITTIAATTTVTTTTKTHHYTSSLSYINHRLSILYNISIL